MPVYTLTYADGRTPAEVKSNGTESPREFLARLVREHELAFKAVKFMPKEFAKAGFPFSWEEAFRKIKPPLRGADVGGLLRQARDAGDARAITREGKLDLKGLDLSRRNLMKASFADCDLSGSSMSCANATGADFRGSCLRKAILDGIVAVAADFSEADMRGCSVKQGTPDWYAMNDVKNRLYAEQMPNLMGAQFDRADLTTADIRQANLSKTRWIGTTLRRASVEGCDMTDAEFGSTDADEAVFIKNKLHVLGLSQEYNLMTDGALFLGNSYVEAPDFLPLVTSTKQAAKNFCGLVDDFFRELSYGTKEVKKDLAFNIAVLGANFFTVSSGAALLGGPLAAIGASVFMVQKGVRQGLGKATEFLMTHLGGALSAAVIEKGGPIERLVAGGVALKALGKQAEVIARAIRRRPEMAPELMHEARQGIFLLDTEDKIRSLLQHVYKNDAGTYSKLLDGSGRLAEATTIIRQVGRNYPDESAPYAVRLNEDGSSVAWWLDGNGKGVMAVAYDASGQPKTYLGKNKARLAASEVSDPQFLKPRAVFEELKDAVVRSRAEFDPSTHEAVVGKDGTIVIRDRATGKVDNPKGPAVVSSDGDTKVVVQGSSEPSLPTAMTKAARTRG